MADAEKILCVWRAVVERLRPWNGWTDYDPLLWDQVQAGAMLIERTPELEANTDYLQLAVYGVVSYLESSGVKRTLVYRRGKPGSENRLHSKLSLGIGGHVNRDDLLRGQDAIVRAAMRRELKEELGLAPIGYRPAGILFDSEATGVEAVHIGLVFDVTVLPQDIDDKKMDESCELVGWFTDDAIRDMYFKDPDQFEAWSQWTIKGLLMTEEAMVSN